MGDNVISWNGANWLTVLLMVGVGFAIYSGVARLAHRARNGE